jgi:hypothetical protein
LCRCVRRIHFLTALVRALMKITEPSMILVSVRVFFIRICMTTLSVLMIQVWLLTVFIKMWMLTVQWWTFAIHILTICVNGRQALAGGALPDCFDVGQTVEGRLVALGAPDGFA